MSELSVGSRPAAPATRPSRAGGRVPGPTGGRAVVRVCGDLDIMSAPDLRRVLVDLVGAGHVDLVVDLTDVTFMDASGLGVLVAALNRVGACQGNLSLVVGSARLLKLFTITGLTGVFTIYPEVDAVPPPAGPAADVASAPAVHRVVALDGVTSATTANHSLATGRAAE